MTWSRLICCCLLTCAWMPLAAEADEKAITREYDVRDLTRRWPSPHAVRLGRTSKTLTLIDTSDEDQDKITTDSLMNLIRDNINKESWEGENRIRGRDGRLVIRNTARQHGQIVLLLHQLREQAMRRIRIELAVYRGPREAVETLLTGGPVLDAQRLATLSRAPWKRLRRVRLGGVQGKPLVRAQVREVQFLAGFDSSTELPEASMQKLILGRSDKLTAWLSSDGEALRIECQTTRADLRRTRTYAHDKRLGDLELPEFWKHGVRTSVLLPVYGASLVGLRGSADSVELTVVRHLKLKRRGDQRRLSARRLNTFRLFSHEFLTAGLRGWDSAFHSREASATIVWT